MRDESLLKLSIITSLIGIIMLFFAIQLIEVKTVKISDITENMSGEKVTVYGYVISVYEKNGNMFLKIRDEKEINVVVFNNHFDIEKDDYVKVEGKIDVYKNKLEIIAESIILI